MNPTIKGFNMLALSVRYNTVLFPFDSLEFLEAASRRGYIHPELPGQPPLGARVEIKGIIGRKGDVSLRLDPDKEILGISAPDLETLVEELDAIEAILKDELDIDSPALALFYELMARIIVNTDNNPLEVWHQLSKEMPILDKFSDILGGDASLFGIRLAPSGQPPNQVNWFDIRLEPSVKSATKRYEVEIIYRHSSRDKVISFTKSLEETVQSLLLAIEQR